MNTNITRRARQWLASNLVIIDTETTGLGDDAEIIEIAAIDCTGKVLLNCLVKPRNSVPAAATAIHGITDEMLADAQSWPEVIGQLVSAVGDKKFIAYNSEFDARLIGQMNDRHCHDNKHLFSSFEYMHVCAMLLYAAYRGEDGNFYGYRRHKLADAAAHEGVQVEGQAHRALADCLMTLGVIKAVARGGRHE